MIVADTNLIAYLLIPGQWTPLARKVLRHDPMWAAPVLWRSELRNVLALHLRQHTLSLPDACAFMEEAETLLGSREHRIESAAVLRLAEQSGCSAYACEFVHLAQQLGVPLVTTDGKLLRTFPGVSVSLEDFTR